MAGGWTADGAVQQQIDDSIKDALAKLRSQQVSRPGLLNCEDCGTQIPQPRREALPGVRLCIACQSARE